MLGDSTERPLALWLLIALLGVLGVRGLLGGGQFLLSPSGAIIGVPTSVLAPTPVETFLLPGLFLFVALGVLPLVVAAGLYDGRSWARGGAIAVAILLGTWAIVEGFVLGFGERLQYVNLVQSVGMLSLAVAPSVREHDASVGGT
ncbi:hypothetical protein [Halobellus ordinarius]|uniref:hypothetical protein n=1 Tax=Halobellus ordinarius TaxID=3075120 RepID=UPI002880932A|nr:hypothetical protein [Halobellus sp. ZY16]